MRLQSHPLCIEAALLIATLVAVIGCHEPAPLYPAGAPDDVLQACALTERKCTACHERDRIVDGRRSPVEWSTTVERMRAYPGSSISRADAEIILRCLNYETTSSSLMPAFQQLASSCPQAVVSHAERATP